MFGVIYYKLADNIYPGDETKGCGLTGPEIDGNFYFLRGMDIDSAVIDAENGTIVFNRLNSEKIVLSGVADYIRDVAGCDISLDGSYYDSKTGSLHLFVNSGETVIDGFLSLSDIHIDCTLSGDGSEEHPFGVSPDVLAGITDEIMNAVDAEERARKSADLNLASKIETEASVRAATDNALAESVLDETRRAKNSEEGIRTAIEIEVETRQGEDARLAEAIQINANAIVEVDSRAKDAEAKLYDAITAETEAREVSINAEKNRAISAETSINAALSEESSVREQSDNALRVSLNEEISNRTNEDADIRSAIEEVNSELSSLNNAITEERNRAISEEESLSYRISLIESGSTEALEEEIERAKAAESELLYKINEEISSRTEAESAIIDTVSSLSDTINEEIERATLKEGELQSSLTEESLAREAADAELEAKISEKDAKIEEDIVIAETSPLYQILSGVWDNNIIPSGTTLTELFKKICSEDNRMFYYIDSIKSDIDDVISSFDNLKIGVEEKEGNSFNIRGTEGSHIIGIAIPKPHSLISVMSSQGSFVQRMNDKFFNAQPRDVISDDIVYTLYYYKINVGLRDDEVYAVTVS